VPDGAPAAEIAEERALLRVAGLHKRFGGVHALTGVDFTLRPNEIHALVGENGAGKSTLVKVLAGLVAPDSGEILLDGEPLRDGRSGRTDPSKIAVVFQELSIVPALSVLDNVFLGNVRVGRVYRRRPFVAEARQILASLGLAHIDVHQPAEKLTLAERQMVEIARAVSMDARIIILDEPTATLSDAEIQRVFAAIRALKDAGKAIIYISHRLGEVFELADRVTTFRNGARVSTSDVASISTDELVKGMIGRVVSLKRDDRRALRRDLNRPLLEVAGLSCPGSFTGFTVTVKRGEIVAVVGQVGSGADEVVRTLGGLNGEAYGSVHVNGRAVRLGSVYAALEHGLAYLSHDRAGEGLFLEAAVETNITSTILGALARGGWLRRSAEHRAARPLAGDFQIDVGRLRSLVSELSGGNQQKVSLAKCVARRPLVLLLNEPTRGVDVGARSEIYRLLRDLSAKGVSTLLFSSDLPEVMDLSDRIVTMFRGRVINTHVRSETDRLSVLRDILHPRAAA
jgi:ribose transport system ATP-binding protein